MKAIEVLLLFFSICKASGFVSPLIEVRPNAPFKVPVQIMEVTSLRMSSPPADGMEQMMEAPVNSEEGWLDGLQKRENGRFNNMMTALRQMDANEVINTAVFFAIAAAILWNLSTIDSGMSRGWTPEEVAARIPVDVWASYSQVLHASPVWTKACTSATVYAIGDVIAQRSEGTSIGGLDRLRVLRSLLAGLIGHGPLSHVWYNVSEHFFDNMLHLTAWWSVFPKVLVDQTIWGPIWNNTYILLLGLMKMESLQTIWSDMKRTTVPLIQSGLKLWVPAHLVTYGLIPVENRLLWVDTVEIAWVTILATQAAGGSHEVEESKTGQQVGERP